MGKGIKKRKKTKKPQKTHTQIKLYLASCFHGEYYHLNIAQITCTSQRSISLAFLPQYLNDVTLFHETDVNTVTVVWQSFALYRMRGQKDRPSSFSPVTSTNVGISLRNILTFSFNHFPNWHKISKPYLVPVPNY